MLPKLMMAGKGDELTWYKGIPSVVVMCTCIDGWDWWERLLRPFAIVRVIFWVNSGNFP
jgi:hypothetical protein